jgi:hypothetical protein
MTMGREFEIRRVSELPATPGQTWDAITNGTGGWLWPLEYEPRVGGSAAFGGTVTAWDPPRHFAARVEGNDGWFNNLDHVLEPAPGGGTVLRYVHSGIFVDDWDEQFDGASQHTDFYLHTLGQFLRYFTGRTATYVSVDGPPASMAREAFDTVRSALGIGGDASVGDIVRIDPDGFGAPKDAVVDYLTPHFLGLRTDEALYRFFGRNAWGQPVGLSIHHFGGTVDQKAEEKVWGDWLTAQFS